MYSSDSGKRLSLARNSEYDFLYKVVLVGDSGVGKSCVLLRFVDDSFSAALSSTIGVDFRFKTVVSDARKIKLQLWDTAGQERFTCITNAYYKSAEAVIILYDITNRESFENLDFWFDEVRDYADCEPEIVVLGNKCDMGSEREVSISEAKKLGVERGITFFEVSAKENRGINEAFTWLADRIWDKKWGRAALLRSSQISPMESSFWGHHLRSPALSPPNPR